jgi:plastocyanin
MRRVLFALPLGLALVLLLGAASMAEGPTIEAAGGESSPYWNPPTAEIAAGGSVSFKNPSASIFHGVAWTGGPETPKCTGVPVDDFKYSWSGSCTFAQAGSYPFKCTVHPEMTGKITVGLSGTTPIPPPPGGSPSGSSGGGPAASGLRLAKRQRGSSVRGSINVGDDGARLVVELRGARALLGTGQAGKMRVGRIVRGAVSGHVGFAVLLKPVARRALTGGLHALPLMVAVTVTGKGDDVFKRTRRVVMLGTASS